MTTDKVTQTEEQMLLDGVQQTSSMLNDFITRLGTAADREKQILYVRFVTGIIMCVALTLPNATKEDFYEIVDLALDRRPAVSGSVVSKINLS